MAAAFRRSVRGRVDAKCKYHDAQVCLKTPCTYCAVAATAVIFDALQSALPRMSIIPPS